VPCVADGCVFVASMFIPSATTSALASAVVTLKAVSDVLLPAAVFVVGVPERGLPVSNAPE
jgi:hypothetical protein